MQDPWNSLEITKMLISGITPAIGGIIAWRLARIGKEIETRQWTDRKILEKRITIYEELVPLLNDIYCFFRYIGHWKEVTPLQVIEAKRKLDKQFHIYAYLFDGNILTHYTEFIEGAFLMYNEMGQDAKIKVDWKNRAEHAREWKKEWETLFTEKDQNVERVQAAYTKLLEAFRKELNLRDRK